MKILFFLVLLANVALLMWEYRQGAFEHDSKAAQQQGREPIVLVSELRKAANEQAVNVDFTSLYPPGLDPRSDNMLTEPFALADFIGELSYPVDPQNKTITPPKPRP